MTWTTSITKRAIYVGYRYFDSFDKPVRYPFGFGLSYTRFELTAISTMLEGSTVKLPVTVTNTGAVPGKEVVQVYLSAPQGGRHKEYQRLMAFAKTEELAPGASQTVELAFDLADGASYDEAAATWVLDAGIYAIRVGNSSRNTAIAATVKLPASVVVRQCKHCCAPTDELPTFAPETVRAWDVPDDVPVLAAALTLGVQSHRNVGVSVKHFCCNNQEDNRVGVSSNVSERALREIYLKGLEIAVKMAQPKTVMSSYNQLNHVYTANRHDLLTEILRCEWGVRGLAMTD